MTKMIKKMLSTTLKEEMAKKSLQNITVSQLSEACGISRQSFYNNFQDIYDLVEWTYINDAHVFLGAEVTADNWQEALMKIFKYMEDNREFVLNTYRSISKDNLERFLHREVEQFLTTLLMNELTLTEGLDEQVAFSIRFYTYALVGVALDWVEHRMKESSKELVAKIEGVMFGAFLTRTLL